MDARSVATKAAADGLSPAPYVKNLLIEYFPTLPRDVGSSTQLFSQDIGRALLNESVLYLLRAMSHMVSYEVIYSKHQFSWALVTLYYANYFCALSMNRLAGKAISSANGKHYEVTADRIQSSFQIKRIGVNNHTLVWDTNYNLYADFNWQDSSYNGTLIKVSNRNHFERKLRENINYHPDSYKELFSSRSNKNLLSCFGKNYWVSPTTVLLLPFPNETEKDIANLECRSIGRQIILLTILGEIKKILQPSSKSILVGYFNNFSKNIMNRPPFNSKLKLMFQSLIQDCLS